MTGLCERIGEACGLWHVADPATVYVFFAAVGAVAPSEWDRGLWRDGSAALRALEVFDRRSPFRTGLPLTEWSPAWVVPAARDALRRERCGLGREGIAPWYIAPPIGGAR